MVFFNLLIQGLPLQQKFRLDHKEIVTYYYIYNNILYIYRFTLNIIIFIISYGHFSDERIPGCILNSAIPRAKVPQLKAVKFPILGAGGEFFRQDFLSSQCSLSSIGGARGPGKLWSVLCLLDDISCITLPCKNIPKFSFLGRHQKLSYKNLPDP